jgi:serine/threonine protein phosphatase PrpC
MNYKICISTDKGIVKKVNQDATMVKIANTASQGRIVMGVLCDGMGGLSHGEVASASAIEGFADWFVTGLPRALTRENSTERLDTDEKADIMTEVEHHWFSLVQDINSDILKFGDENKCRLGTTIVAFLKIGEDFLVMNVGDSRVYLADNKKLTLLTHDQSVVQDMIDKGIMTEKEAEESPQKSVLLQCVGASERVVPQFVRGKITGITSILMCSDGFWRRLSGEEIRERLVMSRVLPEEEMKKDLDNMVEKLKEMGETDNISAIHIAME